MVDPDLLLEALSHKHHLQLWGCLKHRLSSMLSKINITKEKPVLMVLGCNRLRISVIQLTLAQVVQSSSKLEFSGINLEVTILILILHLLSKILRQPLTNNSKLSINHLPHGLNGRLARFYSLKMKKSTLKFKHPQHFQGLSNRCLGRISLWKISIRFKIHSDCLLQGTKIKVFHNRLQMLKPKDT